MHFPEEQVNTIGRDSKRNAITLGHQKDPSNIIGASRNYVFSRWAPREIINLHSRATRGDGQCPKATQVRWLRVPESGARLPVFLLELHVVGAEVTAIRSLRWGV